MKRIAIVGGGPKRYIPELKAYHEERMIWIGADQGAEVLYEQEIPMQLAIGDFDSVTENRLGEIRGYAAVTEVYPEEKDDTDLELAIKAAIKEQPDEIYLFGVTGGRIDHTLANIHLLHQTERAKIKAIIIDKQNHIELTTPGEHQVKKNNSYPYISFIPMSLTVENLTLQGFYYPLENKNLPIGSTLCMSNKLVKESGTFSYSQGILLLIRSRDS
ncbi:thiamine pyrophosphokinase [Thalassobacillus cyri]|uniref:Thiamine diphosphokinase n=1 Tax=Thalassobacillus cyri TaxID=571932 RepID=A0A1H4HF72_9BACI|nr:thiamine diphosphokinase [Thalassobacillus cyri]SEB19688.1 thiamine pyrophosphokinase [Thalassobacillus cyri]